MEPLDALHDPNRQARTVQCGFRHCVSYLFPLQHTECIEFQIWGPLCAAPLISIFFLSDPFSQLQFGSEASKSFSHPAGEYILTCILLAALQISPLRLRAANCESSALADGGRHFNLLTVAAQLVKVPKSSVWTLLTHSASLRAMVACTCSRRALLSMGSVVNLQ